MKNFLLLLVFVSITSSLHAQQLLGIRNSNYAGIQGAALNPSSIVDSKLPWDVYLLSANTLFDNTFLYAPKESLQFFGFKKTIKGIINEDLFVTRYNPENPNELFHLTLSAEAIGPSFMINIGKRQEIGLLTAARFYSNIPDVTGHFGQNAYVYLLDPSLWYTTFHDQSTKLNSLGWFEYGLNYAAIISAHGRNEWKGGVTLKYLQGIAGAYIKNMNLTYNIQDTSNLIFTNSSLDYGRTDLSSYNNGITHGSGFGGNIGFTYVRLRNSSDYTYEMDCKNLVDPDKNKYVYRIGVSLIDVGTINFNTNAATFHLETDSANYLNWNDTHISSNIQLDHILSAVFYHGDSTKSMVANHFRMALPAAVSVQADWNCYKNFFVNATIIKGIGHGNNPGVTRPDIYSITPRYESKWFEVAVPLSMLYYGYWQPRAGLAVRAAYFYIGGDAPASLLKLSDMESVDFYAGLHFFIPQKKLKDRDHDQVSDKLDQCPDEKGTCKTNGCPDRDGDGVIDRLDECPDQPGPAYAKGCPDRDHDSIPDKEDQCPDLKGPRSLHGCPDTDGDGIIDPEDSCPTVKGLPQFHGCPDSDGDGIPDNRDECPNEPGTAKAHGCPDRDNDGVPDYKDKCPDVAGIIENNGCPSARQVEVPSEVALQILENSQKIKFKINSNQIGTNLYAVLDQIADTMKHYPSAKWRIEGYTDATGSDEYNMKLSLRRAQMAGDYLMKKGIPAENLSMVGMGKKNPVASNKTGAGRTKNRRIEIKEQK